MANTAQKRVFALKYRPAVFEELVGQDHVRQTLTQAVRKSRIATGYIFAGPRGVGKTSAARIFAKALNCAGRKGDERICDRCDSCAEIAAGISMDVIEMDGASNRKIEDVRQLRENVRFAPNRGPYKVYIIDEVHMLTAEAFNALLKTLEEPPEHVVFILATTDPQKVPETIHSRCQRLDFHPVSEEDLQKWIKSVASKEKIKLDARAVEVLTDLSEGSVRDALGILEQAAAYGDGKVDESVMTQMFGLPDAQTIVLAAEAIAGCDRKAVFETVDRLAAEGRDISHFLLQLARFFRRVLTAATPASIADKTPPDILNRFIELCLQAEQEQRHSRQPHLSLLVYLCKMIESAQAPAAQTALPNDLESRLQALEKKLSQGVTAGTVETAPAPSAAPSTSPAQLEKMWPAVVKKISAQSMQLGAFIKEAKPVWQDGKTVQLTFGGRYKLHYERVGQPHHIAKIESAMAEVFGESGWKVQTLYAGGPAPAAKARAPKGGTQKIPTIVKAVADVMDGDVIQSDD